MFGTWDLGFGTWPGTEFQDSELSCFVSAGTNEKEKVKGTAWDRGNKIVLRLELGSAMHKDTRHDWF